MNVYESYYLLHAVCPNCKQDNIEQTCVGYFMSEDGPKNRDGNRATCGNCGWRGIVHDLVPMPKKDNQ
jgi:predicted RNA-binding Zn-ribbon protein involved in translation (DUF1610 family)